MSDRHVHVTSYVYDTDPERLVAFESELLRHFRLVQRVMADPQPQYGESKPCLIAWALYTKDSGYNDLIYTLTEAAEALAGILESDIDIVSAWEHASDGAQRVWKVPGRRYGPHSRR